MSASDQNTQHSKPERKSRRHLTRIILVISLTLNLLVLGLIIGAKLSGHDRANFDHRGPERGVIRDLGFAPIAKALNPKDRREIGREFRREGGSFKENRATLERDFEMLLKLLRAEAFDKSVLENAMSQQADRMRSRGESLRNLVVDRIVSMSPEERKAFADRLEATIDRRSHR
ncbi:periplasmic heavy metal sensor [Aliiroseovarius sp. F20344]|uniref:periplasmic heavy metal sensor n=1 Tax=Aliiroseovarius sp. F20344 TaxID=2926414 RepID=UPI001FF1CB32|nr:periplasmic heavy metal sensor [Aliiroseovarius sp. F20344]MCK0142473.1 periplasmic heavy metal sensor [Aliiroseovarius sp. F20344]